MDSSGAAIDEDTRGAFLPPKMYITSNAGKAIPHGPIDFIGIYFFIHEVHDTCTALPARRAWCSAGEKHEFLLAFRENSCHFDRLSAGLRGRFSYVQ